MIDIGGQQKSLNLINNEKKGNSLELRKNLNALTIKILPNNYIVIFYFYY